MNKTDIETASDLIYRLEKLDEFFDLFDEGWSFNGVLSSGIDHLTSHMRSAANCLTNEDKVAISKYVNKKLKVRQKELVKELESMGVDAEI